MRVSMIRLVLAAGLVAAAAAPALACSYSTQASTDQQQQTADATPPADTVTR